MTAEVIELKEDFKLVDGRLVAQNFMKAIFNGYEGDIIVPETVVFEEKSYRVTSIGEKAFARSYSLKSVAIPDSVTSIGEMAFQPHMSTAPMGMLDSGANYSINNKRNLCTY